MGNSEEHKAKLPSKHHHELPQWFRRLRQKHHTKSGKFDWSRFEEEGFDEDLSEASDGEGAQSDGSSEQSYNGVDADAYYDLKEMREERK